MWFRSSKPVPEICQHFQQSCTAIVFIVAPAEIGLFEAESAYLYAAANAGPLCQIAGPVLAFGHSTGSIAND